MEADAIAGELQTLNGPNRASFERPYGWGWLLKLAAELEQLAASDPRAVRWRDALAALAQAMADRFVTFLPRATYPTRAGTHGNSAFALLLALDYWRGFAASSAATEQSLTAPTGGSVVTAATPPTTSPAAMTFYREAWSRRL